MRVKYVCFTGVRSVGQAPVFSDKYIIVLQLKCGLSVNAPIAILVVGVVGSFRVLGLYSICWQAISLVFRAGMSGKYFQTFDAFFQT